MIPVEKCKSRRLYKIHSRNLSYGVYDAERRGFIGIRTKFSDRYLFTEYHYDNGPPFGTVMPQEATEYVLPDTIRLAECLDDVCSTCDVRVKFVLDNPKEHRGHWEHLEDTDCINVCPCAGFNKTLFDWLEEHADSCMKAAHQ